MKANRRPVQRYASEVLRISEEDSFEHHGAAVLLLVRDKGATNWSRLCHLFHFDPAGNHSGHFVLRRTIRGLMAFGFLEKTTDKGPYRVTDALDALRNALGLSLVETSILRDAEAMVVEPRFGPRPDSSDGTHVFALMPFSAAFDPVYRSIGKVCRQLRISLARADELSGTREIVKDIWSGICNAGVVVADCSTRNANVFYEIGIAHTVGRRVILIGQDVEEIPFDVQHLRCIVYENTPRGLVKFQERLGAAIRLVRRAGWGGRQ